MIGSPESLWREGATPEEEALVFQMDLELATIRERSSELCRARQLIANRACQRAIYRRKNNHAADNISC